MLYQSHTYTNNYTICCNIIATAKLITTEQTKQTSCTSTDNNNYCIYYYKCSNNAIAERSLQ